MRIATRHGILAAMTATLLLASAGLATGADQLAPNGATLPKQTNTHFFEIYHCGELAGVVWVTPGEAASFRANSLRSPQVRKAAFDARARARETGTAFAVHGTKGGCADA